MIGKHAKTVKMKQRGMISTPPSLFQVKESKLKRMEELREKFEADKKRQLAMKQERKFKPM